MSKSSVIGSPAGEYEYEVFYYLVNIMGINVAAACGVLANIYHESSFNFDTNKGVGIVDSNGLYSYGLCQWNGSRFNRLKEFSKQKGKSYRDLHTQLMYLQYELDTTESSAKAAFNVAETAEGAREAGFEFCRLFERPKRYASDGADRYAQRGALARDSYWPLYSDPSLPSNPVLTLGEKIVEEAREKVGDQRSTSEDGALFVYRCYSEAGKNLVYNGNAESLYNEYMNEKLSHSVTPAAADLLFYKYGNESIRDRPLNPDITPLAHMYMGHVAIATGEGGRILVTYASDVGGALRLYKEVVEEDTIGSPDAIIRILADSETNTPDNTGDPTALGEADYYTTLTIRDRYAESISANLTSVEEAGFDYGYLIDLTHHREFKFYIPQFSEAAGANWEPVSIIGRSVQIMAYNNTNSRNITIVLDLYAGAGLYEGSPTDTLDTMVDKLHEDANFLKSLEYPDYSSPIVRPPSTVQLILGSSINLVGVVSNVIVEHMKPFDMQNRAIYLKVTFTVTQLAVEPPDYRDIRAGVYNPKNTYSPRTIITSTTEDEGGEAIVTTPTETPVYNLPPDPYDIYDPANDRRR